MQRVASIALLVFAAGLPACAEEIALKDGTKIVGHMTALVADKIEVETSYGKMQLKRADIVSISFPENGPAATGSADAQSATKTSVPRLDESLVGTQYVNRSAKFAMTLPSDWVLSPGLRRAPETLAAFSSSDKTRFALVVQEDYPGSIESYKELSQLNARRTLNSFEELAVSNLTIDGKTALLTFYRGVAAKDNSLPIEFVTAIIQSGHTYTKVTAWCVEPLIHDMQPAFEKLLKSYRTTGQTTASALQK